jgi:hypothetical protein
MYGDHRPRISEKRTGFCVYDVQPEEIGLLGLVQFNNILLPISHGGGTKMKRDASFFILSTLILSSLLLFSCLAPPTGIIVKVNRENYQPRIKPSVYDEYKGRIMLFDSIDIEAPNVENLYYLSEDKTIGYTLLYTAERMPQPVVSFFWYALQKAFTDIGINVKEDLLIKNAPQIHLNILYLTDQNAKFKLSLLRNKHLLMQKEISVSNKFPPTKNISELEKRSYEFIDLIAEAILSDPDFKREFFSEKGRIN